MIHETNVKGKKFCSRQHHSLVHDSMSLGSIFHYNYFGWVAEWLKRHAYVCVAEKYFVVWGQHLDWWPSTCWLNNLLWKGRETRGSVPLPRISLLIFCSPSIETYFIIIIMIIMGGEKVLTIANFVNLTLKTHMTCFLASLEIFSACDSHDYGGDHTQTSRTAKSAKMWKNGAWNRRQKVLPTTMHTTNTFAWKWNKNPIKALHVLSFR